MAAASEPRALEPFIKQAQDDRVTIASDIFIVEDPKRSPLLLPGTTNRILIYTGSFNPPHLSHFKLLETCFNHGGADWNIVAAVVVPMDDNRLRNKFASTETPILSKEQRVDLWQHHDTGREWYWVYSKSSLEFLSFQSRLKEVTLAEGFNVSFVALLGPDYVQQGRLPQLPCWGCTEVLVSNAGRAADFAGSPSEGLVTLDDCGPWERINFGGTANTDHDDGAPDPRSSGPFEFSISPRLAETAKAKFGGTAFNVADTKLHNSIWQCIPVQKPDCIIRFLFQATNNEEISSTRVRAIMTREDKDEMLNELRKLVLCPEILFTYIDEINTNPSTPTASESE